VQLLTCKDFVSTEYLAYCYVKVEEPYTIDKFCGGRRHPSFETFFKYLLPAIAGKNKIKNRIATPVVADNQICTVSDEAFAMLVLENNYDRWVDVQKNKREGSTGVDPSLALKSDKRKRKWESNVSPKYTEGGIVYSQKGKATQKGWKDEGIQRFNVLCQQVNADRNAYPDVVPKMIQAWKAVDSAPKTKVTDDIVPETAAYHELWDDETEPMQAQESKDESNSSGEEATAI
jgi:hypothetical protein